MWPWGHLAAGYLVYRLLFRRRPDALPALALAFATQLPDLIDKPFAWTIPILPNGRSLGHSLVVAGPLLLTFVVLTDGRRRRVALAASTGYLVHLGTDALYPLLEGNFYYASFLAWPVVPPVEYSGAPTGILSHFLHFQLTPQSGFEILLFACGALLWVLDGRPGLGYSLRVAKDGVARVRRVVAR